MSITRQIHIVNTNYRPQCTQKVTCMVKKYITWGELDWTGVRVGPCFWRKPMCVFGGMYKVHTERIYLLGCDSADYHITLRANITFFQKQPLNSISLLLLPIHAFSLFFLLYCLSSTHCNMHLAQQLCHHIYQDVVT